MSDSIAAQKLSASFKDPDGFLFKSNNILYRQINTSYKDNYDCLISSGLYENLAQNNLLISHDEEQIPSFNPEILYKIIRPEIINFISYPYEWCFSQLKDAALLTLKIQKESLGKGMSLKDCSAFNVQFKNGKPIFIDSLSFEKYKKGQPWVAYRQFCQHFLAPLALMSYTDVRLNSLFKQFIDGVPLDLAAKLLPFKTRFNFSLLTHIYLHADAQKHFSIKSKKQSNSQVSDFSLLGIIDSLESSIKSLKLKTNRSHWTDYYSETNYSPEAFKQKKKVVTRYLEKSNSKMIWDLGANTGVFSEIASQDKREVVSFEVDPIVVEKNYNDCKKDKKENILPLLMDLTNPSSAIGFQSNERLSLIERGPADTALALALIHHLAISNNLPFDRIAQFLSEICDTLIIEFIPKTDSQVQRLLQSRKDIFINYNQNTFEKEFKKFFTVGNTQQISESQRILYLMHKK